MKKKKPTADEVQAALLRCFVGGFLEPLMKKTQLPPGTRFVVYSGDKVPPRPPEK